MKKLLITGGAGFIGSHLVDLVVENGYSCIVVDNLFQNSFKNIEHRAHQITFYETDIMDGNAIEDVFSETKPDIVIHLAAHHFIPYCNKNPLKAFNVNILGTQIIADKCQKHRVKKVFFASSAAVYGVSDKPHNEGEQPAPTDIYGLSKYAGEKIMFFFHEKTNTPVVIGRFFNAIGPRETNPHIIPEILKQISATYDDPKLELGNIYPKRDYIHASDMAYAVVKTTLIKQDDPFEVVNIGSGEEYSIEELVDVFSEVLGKRIPIQISKKRMRSYDRPHLCSDITRIKTKYGWEPKMSLQEAVQELLADIGNTGLETSRT